MHAYVFVSVQIYDNCGMVATDRGRKLEYGSLLRIKKRRKHNWFLARITCCATAGLRMAVTT